ncbi:MAG: tubulin-like doman-containing protein [Aristaeellaceae bacterium]
MTMVNAPSTLMNTINQDALLDVSIERVKKLPTPLLVIGLGGTGVNAVKTIKRVFAERYVLPKAPDGQYIPVPSHTAYLGIDTDAGAQGDLSTHEFVNITYSDIALILNPTQRNALLTPDEHAWIHRSLNAAGTGLGAGGNRQAARLMLSRNYQLVANAITAALSGILARDMGDGDKLERLEVVIVTGVCGGTGAGIFLDIPQIIRHCMKTDPGLASHRNNFQITGYIVMPDVSQRDVDDPIQRKRLKANGFASLKELDFWMGVGDHHTPYTAKYYGGTSISWSMPPYSKCILISGGNAKAVYSDASEVVREIIAENLLHYLADELPSENSKGVKQFTYISQEDNIDNDLANMNKPLPVGYRYRAISAYTKRIPKRKVLYYEGRLLFNTFMPMRDEHGELVPNPQLIQECKSREHAAYIVGDAEKLYMDFCRIATLKDFCSVSPDDTPKLDAMRQWPIRPHDQYDHGTNPWLSSIVTPQANRAAEEYLKQAWKRFLQFAEQIINDPKQGPFSLRMYLTAENNGLRSALSAYIKFWDNRASQFASERGSLFQSCRDSWHDFEKPPFFGGKKAVEAYMTHLNRFYNGLRKHAFMVAYAKAANQLLKRVDEFIEDALRPLCRDLDELQKRFDAPQLLTVQDDSDLVHLTQMTDNIDLVFRTKNEEGQITQDFLTNLFACATASQLSANSTTSGVVFTYKLNGQNNVLTEMRNALNRNCPDINGQSLDALMQQIIGTDIEQQNRYMDNLANSFLNGTQPLLIMDSSTPHITFSYLSIPDDSPKHFQHYKNTLGRNVQPKQSSLRDHIYCLTAWDGLPMHSYSLMGELEAAYYECLPDPEKSKRFHLVWNGDPNSDYTHNWCKLPSPCPYYFFSATADPICMNDWKAVQELTARALACGQLSINTRDFIPTFKVRTFWADVRKTVPLLSDSICQRTQDITDMKINPATGAAPKPDERLAMYQAYLAETSEEIYSPGRSPACMAADQGLEGAPIDPYDPDIALNNVVNAVATENHRKLCQALTAAVIASNPRLRLTITQQLEGFETLHKAIASIENRRNLWEPRIAYVETFGRCMMYKLIRFTPSNIFYRNEMDESAALISEPLLADDLKGEISPLVKTAAYLADLPEANPVRQYLEFAVTQRQQQMTAQEMDGTLTAETMKGIVEYLTTLIAMAEGQRRLKSAELTKMGADIDSLSKSIALLDAYKAFLTNQKESYTFALQMMG